MKTQRPREDPFRSTYRVVSESLTVLVRTPLLRPTAAAGGRVACLQPFTALALSGFDASDIKHHHRTPGPFLL